MTTRIEIALKYDQQYRDMHDEFFETINKGTPKQERVLRGDKSANALNARNAEITQNYEAELTAKGFEGLNPYVEPPRDLLKEVDKLTARLDKITKVKGVA